MSKPEWEDALVPPPPDAPESKFKVGDVVRCTWPFDNPHRVPVTGVYWLGGDIGWGYQLGEGTFPRHTERCLEAVDA